MYDFNEIISREGTDSIKYDSMAAKKGMYPADTIPMFIADMDFACPPQILEAIRRRLDRRILGYTRVINEEYYEILNNWYKTRYSWTPQVKPVISHGVVNAIYNLVQLTTKPGDGVIIFTPSYAPFEKEVDKAEGRKCVYCPLKYNDGKFTVDFDLFEKLCRDTQNKLFILCNPHNPTGRVWTEEELIKIGKICFDNDVFVISDEIHADLTRLDFKVTPFAGLFPDQKNMVVCAAPSKTFNLAGMLFSNIFIFDETIEKSWHGLCDMMPNPLALEAAKAAYGECAGWLDELRAYLDKNFEFLDKYIKENLPKAKFSIPEATYLGWIDFSAYGIESKELEELIAKHGVLAEGGHQFVADADGFLRVNCACPLSVLKVAAERICKALNEK